MDLCTVGRAAVSCGASPGDLMRLATTEKEKCTVQQRVLGKLDIHLQKNKIRFISFSLDMYQFKIDQKPVKTEISRWKYRKYIDNFQQNKYK